MLLISSHWGPGSSTEIRNANHQFILAGFLSSKGALYQGHCFQEALAQALPWLVLLARLRLLANPSLRKGPPLRCRAWSHRPPPWPRPPRNLPAYRNMGYGIVGLGRQGRQKGQAGKEARQARQIVSSFLLTSSCLSSFLLPLSRWGRVDWLSERLVIRVSAADGRKHKRPAHHTAMPPAMALSSCGVGSGAMFPTTAESSCGVGSILWCGPFCFASTIFKGCRPGPADPAARIWRLSFFRLSILHSLFLAVLPSVFPSVFLSSLPSSRLFLLPSYLSSFIPPCLP